MRRTGLIALIGVLLSGLGVVLAGPAQACSCAGGTTAEFVEDADAVFTGRLVSREEPAVVRTSADPALHVFAVDDVFKGRVTDRQEILSPVSGATCGLEIVDDGPVAVFATRSPDPYINGEVEPADDQYFAYLCNGTAPLTPQLEADLAAYAPATPARVPAPGPDPVEPRTYAVVPPDDDGGLPVLLGLGLGAVVLLVGAVAILLFRRRDQRASGDPPPD